VVSFPNCKINLGLHIVEKRSDGYHNLETVFYPIQITDVLEVIPAHAGKSFAFSVSGLPVAGETETNLCVKAWQLLKKDFPQLPAVTMHLHKYIPMGAGLGGGSADSAFTLQLLNEKYKLGLSAETLARYALQLGSDCPFFIFNSPVFASGRGEILQPLQLDLGRYSFLVVNPKIHISTAQAFGLIKPGPPLVALSEAILQPVDTWKEIIRNDFEEPAFYYHPELQEIKNWLYNSGAIYASMTGTGSCFYGIFEGELPDGQWESYKLPSCEGGERA